MDTKKLRKHYNQLQRDKIIDLLIQSRIEIELLSKENNQYIEIKRLKRTIKRALEYIDFYTLNNKYITGNDRELINILKTGVPGIWYETYKAQQKENKRTNTH
jgi:phenylacetate-coenzyme A ligase PaaK-like adenylate-forming protein